MKKTVYSSVFAITAAIAAIVLPQFALAQSQVYYGQYTAPTAQVVVTTQMASGTTIPSSAATVTVVAAGASLSGTPSSTGSTSYSTNFNDTKVITFVPGNYSVTVSPLSGYTYTYSSGCTGAVSTGGTAAVCTVTASGYGSGAASLMVYTNVQNSYNNTYGIYSPSNFTITVSGSSPTPSSFQGSQSGTLVTLGSGAYSVYPTPLIGWTASQSGSCSGNITSGENRSCTVTYSYNGSGYYNGYPYNNPTLTCTPSYSQVRQGTTATFTAAGGMGTYTWTTADRTYLNSGSVLNTVLQSSGVQSVIVTSAGQTATCTVSVTSDGYTGGYNYNYTYPTTVAPVSTAVVLPVSSGYVVPGVVVVPSLPNTGFEPQDGAGIAFALVALLAAAALVYPYVRKTIAAVRG